MYTSTANKTDLSKINKNIDSLVLDVVAKDYSDSMDLNILPAPMRVTYFPSELIYENGENSRELTLKSSNPIAFKSRMQKGSLLFTRFSKMMANNREQKIQSISMKDIIGFPDEAIIVGDCKEKVTSLAIRGNLRFVESECTVNNLILEDCYVNETGKRISSDYVYFVDNNIFFPNIFFPLKRLYRAKTEKRILCGIKFYEEYAVPKKIESENQGTGSECLPIDDEKIYYKNVVEQYGFVSPFSSIELEVDDDVTSIHNCNISIQMFRYEKGPKLSDFYKMPDAGKIKVTLKGNAWRKMGKQSIIIEAENPDILDIDPNVTSKFNIEKKNIFVYIPKKLEEPKKGLGVGEIVGIVVGCVAFVGIIVGVCVFFFVCRKNKASSSASNK